MRPASRSRPTWRTSPAARWRIRLSRSRAPRSCAGRWKRKRGGRGPRRMDPHHQGAMSGYNFTDQVRKVLQMAREEAARLHHEDVGTQHILLGLIREGEGVAAAVLSNPSVDLE